MKEGRNWFLCCLQQLRSYCNKIETWNQEKIPFYLQIVLQGVFQLQKNHRQPFRMPHICIYRLDQSAYGDPDRAPLKAVLGGLRLQRSSLVILADLGA